MTSKSNTQSSVQQNIVSARGLPPMSKEMTLDEFDRRPAKLRLIGLVPTPKTEISKGRYVCRIIAPDGAVLHLWSYKLTVKNDRNVPIELLGRNWRIDDHKVSDISMREGFAPFVGTHNPKIVPDATYAYEAGVCTDNDVLKTVGGQLKAREVESKVEFVIQIPNAKFEPPTESVSEYNSAGQRLSEADSKLLRQAVSAFNEQSLSGNAHFCADDIDGLSAGGRQLIDSFLLRQGRLDRSKRRSFEFKSIIQDQEACLLEGCNDHFILKARSCNVNIILPFTVHIEYIHIVNSTVLDAVRVVKKAVGENPALLGEPEMQALAALFKDAATAKPDFSGKPCWSDEMKKTKAEGRRNPVDFLLETFGDEIRSGSVTRAVIRSVDRSLYQALATYVRRTPRQTLPPTINLLFGENPSARVSKELKELDIQTPTEAYKKVGNRKEADRLYSASSRRQRRR